MRVLTKRDLDKERAFYTKKFKETVFIYPTDTIYGIGCNAEERAQVRKLRRAKEQYERPLSVIVPSKEWIKNNCEVNESAEEWIEKLPGPYTLILELKDEDAVSRTCNLGTGTIGVRLPDHWFTDFVSDMQVPIITTSANITGGKFMRSADDLDEELAEQVEYLVDAGKIEGKPSKIIDLTKKEPTIIRD